MKVALIDCCSECPHILYSFLSKFPCECNVTGEVSHNPDELFKQCPLPDTKDILLKEGVEISKDLWFYEEHYEG